MATSLTGSGRWSLWQCPYATCLPDSSEKLTFCVGFLLGGARFLERVVHRWFLSTSRATSLGHGGDQAVASLTLLQFQTPDRLFGFTSRLGTDGDLVKVLVLVARPTDAAPNQTTLLSDCRFSCWYSLESRAKSIFG